MDTGSAEFRNKVNRINAKSEYGLIPAEKTVMSVPEMRRLLGLKKTDSYWLYHKGCFETKIVEGKMWIILESFEKWYANQVKYRKITGEEPGLELKKNSYSPREIAEELGISEDSAYELIRRERLKCIIVDYWKRVPKEVFDKWYVTQTRYRNKTDREKEMEVETATITMPEMARLLGVPRQTVYGLLKSKVYGPFFEVIILADRKRITKESFQNFLNAQDEYCLCEEADEKKKAVKELREKKFLNRQEAALLAGVSNSTITKWSGREHFPFLRTGNVLRIPREEFEEWLRIKDDREEEKSDGID